MLQVFCSEIRGIKNIILLLLVLVRNISLILFSAFLFVGFCLHWRVLSLLCFANIPDVDTAIFAVSSYPAVYFLLLLVS
jgi:hypothetical protein